MRKISIFLTTLLLFTSTTYAFWNSWEKDNFNYADEKSPQLKQGEWNYTELGKQVEVTVLQAKAVIYWSKELNNKIKWKCENNNSRITIDIINIRHTECLLFIPLDKISVKVAQGQVILVQPKSDISVEVFQGKLRIAENGESYKYNINGKEKHNQFISHKNAAVTISANLEKSSIKKYIVNK